MARRYYLILIFFTVVFGLSAQPSAVLDVPYFCGFENPSENANWIPVSSTDNKWVIGDKEKSEGVNGMYVAHNNGAMVGTSSQQGYMCVYRVVTLEARVEYEIAFDWKNPGIGNSELYVCWLPDTATVPQLSSSVWDLPSWFKNCVVSTQGDAVYSGSSLWRNDVIEVMGTGQPMKLMFFFRSKSTSFHEPSQRAFSAACIDNVQINKKLACLRPRNIEYTQLDASRGMFSWEGELGPFDLMYKGVADTSWTVVKGITNFDGATLRYQCPVRPLRKGAYFVKIKQLCEDEQGNLVDYSMWTSKDIVVNYSDNSCLDFLDLDGPHVDCYVGEYSNPYGKGPVPPIDYGYTSQQSRHTVHYDPNEYDKWTNYNLKTTPPDGLPSVRLGNYTTASDLGQATSMAEAITYHYTVDPDAPILLIKFAMLLEDSRHGPTQDPKFELIISDPVTGEDLGDVICGRVDFVADFDDPSFQKGAPTTHDGSPVMLYKDWTTTGMNLQDLAGRDIDITFVSKECARTGHASYAYFAMDCMGAKITGIGCGDDMFGQIEAPDGFRYKWYPKSLIDGLSSADSARVLSDYFANPAFADTLITFNPPGGTSDDGIYVCRIFSKEEESCWFELQADLDPRDVFAQSALDVKYDSCNATVSFKNSSYTKTRNRGDIGVCDYFQWEFGNGLVLADENPVVSLDPGTYNIKMTASISEGLCEDIWDTTITILPYGESIDTLHIRRCTKDPNYTFIDGITYNTTGVRSHTLKGFAGCDSTVVLDMVVGEEIDIEKSDTITEDETPYIFFDQHLSQSGTYTATVPGIGGDCDTIYTLHLHVWPVLHVNFLPDSLPFACYGDSLIVYDYTLKSGSLIGYDIEFDAASLDAGFSNQSDVPDSVANGEIRIEIPSDAMPGKYPAKVVFDGDTTGTESFDFVVDLFYASSIISQKWNDVIAVHNASENGGYEFDSYAWYCNGRPIAGANSSYLYVGGDSLLFGAEYQVLLRRASDGVTTFSCPLVAVDRADKQLSDFPGLQVLPTMVAPRSVVSVDMPAGIDCIVAEVFDMMGKSHGVFNISNDSRTITMPPFNGLFIIRFTLSDKLVQTVKVLVK